MSDPAISPLRLAVWQGQSPAGDAAAGIASLRSALMAAAAMQAEMLVAPEVWLPGYNQPDISDQAQGATGPWIAELATLCREAGCGLTLGFAERDGPTVYNAAIALGKSGEPLALYRKIQLYGGREKSIYAAGSAYRIFQLGPHKAALLICYDIEFAPHVAALAALGVTVILVPTANMLPYSARKKNDHRMPLYSVWNPPTSSLSASARSNGARLLLARVTTKNTKKARKATSTIV